MTPSYSTVPWQPGQQSPASMEARKAQCTREQLAQLLTSPEYQQWTDKKQGGPSKGARLLTSAPEYLLATMALLVLLLLALQPWVAPTATRAVSCHTCAVLSACMGAEQYPEVLFEKGRARNARCEGGSLLSGRSSTGPQVSCQGRKMAACRHICSCQPSSWPAL